MGAERPDAGAPEISRPHADAAERHPLGHGPRGGRGMGGAARAPRNAPDVGAARPRHRLRGGEIFRNIDLAASLRRIAEHGRSGFYGGATADAILAISREMGGTMTAAD